MLSCLLLDMKFSLGIQQKQMIWDQKQSYLLSLTNELMAQAYLAILAEEAVPAVEAEVLKKKTTQLLVKTPSITTSKP